MAPTAALAAGPTVHTIGVGGGPIGVAYSPARSQVYVADAGSVSVINAKTNTLVSTTGTGVGVQQGAIGAFVNGTKVYVGDNGLNTMVAFNPITHVVTPDINVGFGVTTIAHARAGFAYVGEERKLGSVGFIKVVNTATDRVTASIPLKSGVNVAVAMPGNNRRLWVGSINSGKLWVINTRTNKVVRRLTGPEFLGPVGGIAFGRDGKRVFAFGLGGLAVFSRATGKVLNFVTVTKYFSGAPQAGQALLNPVTNSLLLLNNTDPGNPGKGSIAVIDPRTLKLKSHVQLGNQPLGMVLDQPDNTTYATNFLDNTVSYFTTP